MNEGAEGVGTGFGVGVVAVMSIGEGAAKLPVAGVIVPCKPCDPRLPWKTDGRVREGPEAEGQPHADAAAIALRGTDGASEKAASSIRAFCQEGMRR